MKTIDEMMGVSSAAGMGAPPPGVDPASPESQKYAAPPVYLGKKKKKPDARIAKDPLVRKALSFKEWIEEAKHDVRDAAGRIMKIKKVAIRHPGGKVTMEYPGKSGSSGGGD